MVLGCASRQVIEFHETARECEWSQAGGGPSHMGSASLDFFAQPNFAWKKELNLPLLTEPTISSDYIFIPAPNSGIVILKSDSGERVGTIKAGGPVSMPVAVSDSIMMFNEYGQRLVAVNWITGQRLWTVELYGSDIAPLVFDGRAFWHDGRRNIACFDLREGKRLWSVIVDYDITAPPSACSLGVLFATDKGMLECLSPSDGSFLWSLETESRVKTSPVIYGDHLVFCTVDGKVVAADMNNGLPIWDVSLGMPVVAPIAVDGGGVYIGAHQGELIKLEFSGGATSWSVQLDGPIKGGPSILGNIVVLPTLNHKVFFVDKNEGKVLWAYPTFGMVSTRPAICSDRVYVAGEDENVYCFRMLRHNEQGYKTNLPGNSSGHVRQFAAARHVPLGPSDHSGSLKEASRRP